MESSVCSARPAVARIQNCAIRRSSIGDQDAAVDEQRRRVVRARRQPGYRQEIEPERLGREELGRRQTIGAYAAQDQDRTIAEDWSGVE